MDQLTCNASSGPRQMIKLSITQDTLCPWCYIGWKEMETAILQSYKLCLPLKFDIEFRPFRLDPTLPCDHALNKQDLYMCKFGSERFEKVTNVLNEKGARYGIKFNFNTPIRQSTPSHRLIRYAYEKQRELQIGECVPCVPCVKNDLQGKLLNKLFKAGFEDCEDIGDEEVLARICEEVGFLPREETIDFLRSDAYTEKIEQMIVDAHERGITGVPYTVINSKWAIMGGQTAEVYLGIFEKLAAAFVDY